MGTTLFTLSLVLTATLMLRAATGSGAVDRDEEEEVMMEEVMMEELERQRTPCACYNPLAGTPGSAVSAPRTMCARNPRACYVSCNSKCPVMRRQGSLCLSTTACGIHRYT